MALNGKYVSLDNVIEKVMRDTGMKDQIDVSECAEWAGECIKLIGAVPPYIKNVATIPIKDGRGELPCDLYYLIQAREYDSKAPMRSTTDTFHRHFKRDGTASTDTPTIGEGLYAHQAYKDVEGIFDKAVDPDTLDKDSLDLTYEINDNYIFPSFEKGDVEIAYLGFPVSESGLPKIPDEVHFQLAVEHYIRYKLFYRSWITGQVQDKVLQKEEIDKDWYIPAAKNAANMPSYDEMESLKNNHLRLIPDVDQWSNFFKFTGSQHDVSNTGFDYYGYYRTRR